MQKKKVLLIAYFFPPLGGAGSIRMTKFVKYLPEFGWEPVILTPKYPEFSQSDASLSKEIPQDITVIRTFSIEPTRWIKSNDSFKISHTCSEDKIGESLLSKIRNRIKEFVKTWIFIPDSRMGWLPFAVFRGVQIVRNKKIPVIFATGGPWTDLVIGLLIHLLTGRPLVSDFRDGWTLTLFGMKRPRLRRKIEASLEKLVFEHSEKLIFATEALQSVFEEKYPFISSRKMVSITNGYDEIDFSFSRRIYPKKFVITYTGSFNNFQRAMYFLKSVKEALVLRPDIKKDLSIYFLGTIESADMLLIKELDLEKFIKTLPYVPHAEIPEYLTRSALLLLVLFEGPMSNIYIPCKIYEYLRARVPILAIVPEKGATADLIRKTKAGAIVQPEMISIIAQEIIRYYDAFKAKNMYYPDNEHLTKQFDRKQQAARLASCLSEIAK
jgi:hypothetical protein